MTSYVESLRAPKLPLSNDGRRGKAFSVRLDDIERNRLTELHTAAKGEMPSRPHRHDSLGAFIVWAAMQWKPAVQELPFGKPAKPKRRRPGPTRRPGRKRTRRPTGKKGRRS